MKILPELLNPSLRGDSEKGESKGRQKEPRKISALRIVFEAVAHSGLGKNISRTSGVRFKFTAQIADRDPQEMIEPFDVFWIFSPNLLKNLAVGEHFSGA